MSLQYVCGGAREEEKQGIKNNIKIVKMDTGLKVIESYKY